MQNKKVTALSRVRRYVNSTNSILVSNKLNVMGRYKIVDDVRCIEVMLDGNFIYPFKIELLCDHTSTSLHAITLKDGHICVLLKA